MAFLYLYLSFIFVMIITVVDCSGRSDDAVVIKEFISVTNFGDGIFLKNENRKRNSFREKIKSRCKDIFVFLMK